MTIFGEVLNVTNRDNRRFISFDGINPNTLQGLLSFEKTFPFLPSGGINFDF